MKKKNLESSYIEGKSGEGRAASFLRLKGYSILDKNYRAGAGEIDLVVQRVGVLVFVEVKTRKGKTKGTPLEAVSPQKVRRLSAAAALYLASHPLKGRACRFDVVTIGPEKGWFGLPKIRHFENAFEAAGDFNV